MSHVSTGRKLFTRIILNRPEKQSNAMRVSLRVSSHSVYCRGICRFTPHQVDFPSFSPSLLGILCLANAEFCNFAQTGLTGTVSTILWVPIMTDCITMDLYAKGYGIVQCIYLGGNALGYTIVGKFKDLPRCSLCG